MSLSHKSGLNTELTFGKTWGIQNRPRDAGVFELYKMLYKPQSQYAFQQQVNKNISNPI